MKRSLAALIALSPALVSGASDQRTVCTLDTAERVIELGYPSGTPLPCEVRYTKHGVTEVLWSAQNEPGYCEAKNAEFVEKQRAWGWYCVTQ